MIEIYLAVDGDDIGHRLEYFMLVNERESLNQFSTTFQSSMDWLVEKLTHELEATIIFSGGDNLLAVMNIENLPIELIENIRTDFAIKSQCTLSVGLGYTIRQAYFALKLAKASGKNCIRNFKEFADG